MAHWILKQAISPVVLALGLAMAIPVGAQTTAPAVPPATSPATSRSSAGSPRAGDFALISQALKGRLVESIRVSGNSLVSTSVILNQVRSREGEPLDPATVEEDYKRIYELKRFANVEAKVEPTETGVVVSFIVTEQRQIKNIFFRGNVHVDTMDILEAVDLKAGESIDPFRIGLARQAIERLYREKNYTYVQVNVNSEALATDGELVFEVIEGQKVRVRRIAFEGNKSFSNFRLRGEVETGYYIWIFRAGQLDFDQVEGDVAALRRFYESKGFFDARVGNKLSFASNQKDVQITFVIEEGPRYTIDKVIFNGLKAVAEPAVRGNLKMVEGVNYDREIVDRDVREIVRAYSPFGYVYQAPTTTPNPEYLSIEPRTVFRREAGKVDLVYDIREGKPFRMGRVLVKGNYKTQDKVVQREMHVAPGQLYNSAEITDSIDRLKGLGYFTTVNISPVGEEPDTRDVLVEIAEGRTASFQIGAGISSNGGVGGEISYEQRNFDLDNTPSSWTEIFSERSFTGAGQTMRVYVAPSTQGNSAGIRFTDPYLFDQPYIFSNDLYFRQRQRESWEEDRFGDRMGIGRRLSRRWIVFLNLRGEDVAVSGIDSPELRAPEILDAEGHTTITGAGPSLRYDSTNRGPVLYKGVVATAGYERVGALGGGATFNKYSAGFDSYYTLFEDLFDRKTVLAIRSDIGYIDDDGAPLFEKYYAGGMGSVRGFKYRGISPRSGPENDAVGGVFEITTSAELGYPIYADMIRGVFFIDAGTVERDINVTTYRVAAGFGVRFILPMAPNAPLSLDFGFPVVQSDQDETQLISFAFGFMY